MFKNIILASVLLFTTPAVANAQGFILGLAAGSLLSSGGDAASGGSATVLYTAAADVLKEIDPLSMRMVASKGCFAYQRHREDDRGQTIGEIFTKLTKDWPERERKVLQVLRVFGGQTPWCAAIWFTYVDL